MPKIRNSVARSPLLRKGGVHEKSRSAERQQTRKALKQSIQAALKERRSGLWLSVLSNIQPTFQHSLPH